MGCGVSKEVASQAPAPVVLVPADGQVLSGRPEVLRPSWQPERFETEKDRLRSLAACNMIDTPAEARFDNITALMTSLFGTPVSTVTLVGPDHLWLKSSAGPFGSCVDRVGGFCNLILVPSNPEVLVIEDASKDVRFSENLFVTGAPGIRFYAGAPLLGSDGVRYGTLCVVDFKVRKFPPTLYNTLCNFAELVVRELERDKVQAMETHAEQEGTKLLRTAAALREPVILVDAQAMPWPIKYANDAWAQATGLSVDTSMQGRFWELFKPAFGQGQKAIQRAQDAMARGEPFNLVVEPVTGGKSVPVTLTFRPAANDHLQDTAVAGIPNFVNGSSGVRLSNGSALEPSRLSNDSTGRMSNNSTVSSAVVDPSRFWFAVLQQVEIDDGLLDDLGSQAGSAGPVPHAPQPHAYGQTKPTAFADMELQQLLGAGSFGRVYRARWKGSLVAVKILECPATAKAGSSTQAGLLEAAVTRDLHHPNIVQTLDVAVRGELLKHEMPDGQSCTQELQQVWIIHQYCNRGTLYDAVDRGWLQMDRSPTSRLDMDALLRTAQEVAQAMAYLHSHDVIHGDLTGNNVLLTESASETRGFVALVSDFGLARVATEGTMNTNTFGTVSHMPPELLTDGTLTKAADVYAFGVLLWEMLTGTRAYCGRRAPTIIHAVTSGQSQLTVPSFARQDMKDLVNSCLSYTHTARPTFAAVVDLLAGMLASL